MKQNELGIYRMVSLQCVVTRGYRYWRIVESRRVNGKPRPVPIRHLGTAENILAVFAKADNLEAKEVLPSIGHQERRLDRSLRWLEFSRDSWKEKCLASKLQLKIKTLGLKRARKSGDNLRLKLKAQSKNAARLQSELNGAHDEIERLKRVLASREEELADLKKK